jgi:AcrR family transcriptional regulator
MPIEPLTAERRRQQTREYLLRAAAQVFAERGFHEATIDEVASAAGFTKGAVYSNFKNKEDLFLALLEDAYAKDTAAIKETLGASDVPPEARLGDFVQMMRGEMEEMPNLGALYLEFHLYALRNPSARERMNELERADVRAIAEIIESERTQREIEIDDPVERTARIIVALFRGISMMRTSDPEMAGEDLLEGAIAFVSRGLGVET